MWILGLKGLREIRESLTGEGQLVDSLLCQTINGKFMLKFFSGKN